MIRMEKGMRDTKSRRMREGWRFSRKCSLRKGELEMGRKKVPIFLFSCHFFQGKSFIPLFVFMRYTRDRGTCLLFCTAALRKTSTYNKDHIN